MHFERADKYLQNTGEEHCTFSGAGMNVVPSSCAFFQSYPLQHDIHEHT